MEFSKEDISQIQEKGLNLEQVKNQIEKFKKGNVVVDIREAATIKNGITAISKEEEEELIQLFDSKKEALDLLKFVPASGAATRMFKDFFKFLENYNPQEEFLNDFLERKNDETLLHFFHNLEKLPFYEKVQEKIAERFPAYNNASEDEQKVIFVKAMLAEEGLHLSHLPKGLVPFHKYEDRLATAFEEHLYEAAYYASSQGVAKLHFTVLKEHKARFEECFQQIQERVTHETGTNFEVTYSYQDPKTDTIAVDLENRPFRDEDGSLFFRPGGHGALIENLNNQKADVVFIKNIDNVVVSKFREQVSGCKKMLAGKLLKLQEDIFRYLNELENNDIAEEKLEEIFSFMQAELNSGLSYDFDSLSRAEQVAVLKRKLNRPIRICGMVQNEGEPGGGPFWVTQENGEISLQIVEGAQIDKENYQQSQIVNEATHFNPVDLVCGIKNYKGKVFNFKDFIDPNTSFICQKTRHGKELKALEHPGLWNGAMADWITIFVEVSIETFNPVKTITDLLRPRHQVKD